MRNPKLIPIACLGLATVLLLVATAANAAAETRELPAASGETLVFDLESGGDIEVTGWDREAASVTTEVTGRDADRLQVDVSRTANGIRVASDGSRGSHRYNLVVRVQVPRR